MSELILLTIAEARRELDAGAITSVELTEATLRQIEATEDQLHAYATVLADEALDAARAADRDLRRGVSRGPLHGIPVGIKDLCHMRGTLTAGGSASLAGAISTEDSAVVVRLRAGAAVIVGKTVTSEFAFGPTLSPTRNAWDQARSPEGSSAGSAVAVAARSAFACLGTDTAGSIRAPAGVNGVVGLKPTFGLVATTGVIPMAPSLDHVGPITRTVEDCAAVLSVVAGLDRGDAHSRDVEPSLAALHPDRGLSGVRIGLERTYLAHDLTEPGVLATLARVAATLEALGATVIEVEIPEIDLVEASIVTMKAVEASAYHLARIRDDASGYHQTTRVIIQAGSLIPAVQYIAAQQARGRVTRAVRDTFVRHGLDALLGPGWGPAGLVGRAVEFPPPGEVPFNFPMRANTVNLTGMPAVNIPAGFTDSGIPLGGVELWGRPLGEPTLLSIAAAYEAVDGWHQRVPTIADPTASHA